MKVSDSRLRFQPEPWTITERRVDLTKLGQTESVFALSNGHIGLRGNFDEGEPSAIPGTYLGGFYEERPLPYAEAGYGYPETGQTVVNVTNGKLIRLMVDDSPFDVRYGTIEDHRRVLDMRAGTLKRHVTWTSPAGRTVRVESTRLVSFTHRALVAIRYQVTALDGPTRITLQSELVANEAPPVTTSNDPRVAAALDQPLEVISSEGADGNAMLIHRTRASGLTVAAAMRHNVDTPLTTFTSTEAFDDWARFTVIADLAEGEDLTITKFVGYGWSATRSTPALRDQVAAALDGAMFTGWDGIASEQRRYLDEFWDVADVQVEGALELQQAVRFGTFHTLQAGARAERRGIAAKGLTGPGYDGHCFWDTEAFVLPLLIMTHPRAAADALRWRASTLPQAKHRAATLHLRGAAFPWRTINGDETGAYWPAGTAALHLNADIASAFEDYRRVTGDNELERECGIDVIVETARMWMSISHLDRDGLRHIDGVTGPDEYTGVVDDNVFTNMMAARNLHIAAAACGRQAKRALDLGVTEDEIESWRAAAKSMYIPYDEELGVHPQCENFTRYAEWDFEASLGRYPLMLHAPYFQLYRTQTVKQADLVLAMQWCGENFTPEQKARNVDYYERITVRDSSLSACTQAVMCAEVGHLDLAYEYLREAALMDLADLQHNTKDGLHISSLAGAWTVLVEGFGGLREHGETISLSPALPDRITSLGFGLRWRGARLQVSINHDEVRLELPNQRDKTVPLRLYGDDVVVNCDEPLIVPMEKRIPLLPPPEQPAGRQPFAKDLAPLADGTEQATPREVEPEYPDVW